MSTWQELKDNPRIRRIFEDRIKIVKAVRDFFWSEGFIETETPVAVRYASQEPYLHPFEVKVKHANGEEFPFYLHTSPEFALKKILAAGFDKIFELSKVFRNNEDFGGTHNPEFVMLEWYRKGSLFDIMDDTEKMLKYVSRKLGNQEFRIKNQAVPVTGNWERVTMKELWKKYLDVSLDEYLETESMVRLAKQKGYSVSENDEYEDVFFKIFLNVIEPKLGIDKPVFVYDYPTRMCSLSKLTRDPRYAERFELYVGGLEVANAFGELTDAAEQQKRLEADKALRTKLEKPVWPIDPDFIEAISALESQKLAGVGGIAIGIDRVVVLCTGAKDINEVIFGSVKDQLSS